MLTLLRADRQVVLQGPGGPAGVGRPLGLPAATRAYLFDLDDVRTAKAKLHAAAWKETSDGPGRGRPEEPGTSFVAFDELADYDTYVDGKGRADETRSFLQSRGIDLLPDSQEDRAGAPTITALGAAENAIMVRRIRFSGVQAYPGSIRYVHALRAAGLQTAAVSCSANWAVLCAGGIGDLFHPSIDGSPSTSTSLANQRRTPTWPP